LLRRREGAYRKPPEQVLKGLGFEQGKECYRGRAEGIREAWRYPLARIINKVLGDIDPNHSIDAIEEDEGKDGLLL
jgi:hypothetical protein